MKKLILTLLVLASSISFAQEETAFPVKGEVRVRVDFWKKVYTEIDTTEAFLHDSEDLSIIYRKVNLPKGRRTRYRYLKKEKRETAAILRSIAKKLSSHKKLNDGEQSIYNLTGKQEPKAYWGLARNLRFQYGLRDRYLTGLKRSYQYIDYIEDVFKEQGLPDDLKFLPHVESSFNYHAYSKVGAAGIWQFMRATARIYKLKVSYIVDERRDVFKATKAAARLLKDNYRLLESWPLALTAYNHGARSMQRAVRKLGTKEIHKIIEGYEGRRFGFASKNFYATFMATVEISREPEKYFKSFQKPAPFLFSTLVLPKALTIKQIENTIAATLPDLKEYNPSIRRSAFRSPLFIPKDFSLRLPLKFKDQIALFSKKLDEVKNHFEDMEFEKLHIVSRGESLFDISKMYRVALNDIVVFNQIPNPSRIFAGMKIKIPGKESKISKIKPNITTTTPKVSVAETPIKEDVEKEPTPVPAIISKPGPLLGPSLPIGDSDGLPPVEKEDGPLSLEGYALQTKKLKRNFYQIEIETEETLGHLAEWAGIRTQKIRDWNGLAFGRVIYQGRKLKLWLSEEKLAQFQQRRNEYHLSIQEDFYENFQISSYDEYSVKRGDTLTSILRDLEIPFWLLRKVQKDEVLDINLQVGQKLRVPKLEPKNEQSGLLPEAS